jgi:peptidoglycan hydrolase-like protein with peptidoglycan-binding domain
LKKTRIILFVLLAAFSMTYVADADLYKSGSTGKEVEAIQQQLRQLGFFQGNVTGYFGSQTETAVKKFQVNRGLYADGVVGNGTYRYLFENASSTVKKSTESNSDEKNVMSVKDIQTALKKLGYYTGTVDGISGSNTVNAIKKFQQSKKLTTDGVVGSATAKLLKESAESTNEAATASSNAMSIKDIQTALKKLGYYTGKVDGVSGSNTVNAIKKFQQSKKLIADGVVGPATAKLLKASANSTNETATASRGVSSVMSIKDIQAALKKLGYYTGTVDGVSGSKTINAIKKFQSANKLTADGVVGSSTKKKLQAAAGKVTTAAASKSASGVELLDWWSSASKIFKIGSVATVTDVKSGKTFKIKRTYGTNHADVEALTSNDSEIIRDIWGGWNWTRRPIIVEVGGRRIAASMAAMPHAGVDSEPANTYVSKRSGGYSGGTNLDSVKGNGMDGHMDVHFLNSKTHGTSRVDSKHQAAVKAAAKY